jgi:hypothetical protein
MIIIEQEQIGMDDLIIANAKEMYLILKEFDKIIGCPYDDPVISEELYDRLQNILNKIK